MSDAQLDKTIQRFAEYQEYAILYKYYLKLIDEKIARTKDSYPDEAF